MSFGKTKDDKAPETGSVSASSFSSTTSGEKVEAFLGKGSKVVGALTFSGAVELDELSNQLSQRKRHGQRPAACLLSLSWPQVAAQVDVRSGISRSVSTDAR